MPPPFKNPDPPLSDVIVDCLRVKHTALEALFSFVISEQQFRQRISSMRQVPGVCVDVCTVGGDMDSGAIHLAAAHSLHLPHLLLCSLLLYQTGRQAKTSSSSLSSMVHRHLYYSLMASIHTR